MELSPEQIRGVKNDGILVMALKGKTKIGSLYIPEIAQDQDQKRRKIWRGKIVKFGDAIDFTQWEPHTLEVGDIVYLDPVSLDCPAFTSRVGEEQERFIFVRAEDIRAKEVVEV